VPAAERYLLDTSAVLAFTDREDGFEKVEELLQRATRGQTDVGACAVSLMEVYYLVHKDPEFMALASEISLLNLPYK
jgi:predicted nucleic acid-binding protein